VYTLHESVESVDKKNKPIIATADSHETMIVSSRLKLAVYIQGIQQVPGFLNNF